MISWRSLLLGKDAVIHTTNGRVFTGVIESVQTIGDSRNPFIILTESEDRVVFVPEKIVEGIWVVQEPSFSSEDGEGSGEDGGDGGDDTEATD